MGLIPCYVWINCSPIKTDVFRCLKACEFKTTVFQYQHKQHVILIKVYFPLSFFFHV